MEYSKTTLPNGLRLIHVPMPAINSATLMILVGAGSRFEEKRTNGVTHFLEHMLFKGTKKRPGAKLLSEAIDSFGGEWNGSTGKELSSYYLKAASNNLERGFDVLCDMMTNSLLDHREIEREKGVIKAEIAMYEDTPARRVGEIFETLLYPDSSLGWDIGGTPSTVDRVEREDFTKLYSEFYCSENMVVVVAGKAGEKEARNLTERYLGKLKTQMSKLKTTTQNLKVSETFVQGEPRLLVHEKQTDQAHLVLGVRGNPRGSEDRWAEEILATILGAGMSSRLWIAVRERRGLAYYVRSDVEHYSDNGYLAVSAGVTPGKIEQSIKVILGELSRIRKAKVGEKEIVKAKEFVKGHMYLGLEDTRSVAGFFGSFELLEGKILTPDVVARAIDSVTALDVKRVAEKFFVPEKLNLAVIGPYKDGEKFRKMLEW